MKPFYLKWGHAIAVFSLLVVENTMNTTCMLAFYQKALPKNARKLRKF